MDMCAYVLRCGRMYTCVLCMCISACVFRCVRMCSCVCMCVQVRNFVHMCVHVYVCMFACVMHEGLLCLVPSLMKGWCGWGWG